MRFHDLFTKSHENFTMFICNVTCFNFVDTEFGSFWTLSWDFQELFMSVSDYTNFVKRPCVFFLDVFLPSPLSLSLFSLPPSFSSSLPLSLSPSTSLTLSLLILILSISLSLYLSLSFFLFPFLILILSTQHWLERILLFTVQLRSAGHRLSRPLSCSDEISQFGWTVRRGCLRLHPHLSQNAGRGVYNQVSRWNVLLKVSRSSKRSFLHCHDRVFLIL